MRPPRKQGRDAHRPEVPREVAERLLGAPVDGAPASRSDAGILENIQRCLEQAAFDTGGVRIHVRHGQVQVEGRVESEQVRAAVLELIGGCAGALVTVSRLGFEP